MASNPDIQKYAERNDGLQWGMGQLANERKWPAFPSPKKPDLEKEKGDRGEVEKRLSEEKKKTDEEEERLGEEKKTPDPEEEEDLYGD